MQLSNSWLRARGLKVVFFDQTVPIKGIDWPPLNSLGPVTEKRFYARHRLSSALLAMVVRPETVVRWHRAGFRLFWRWKSRHRLGRPAVPAEIRQVIREMGIANLLWGALRIHGELLRLGIDVGQTGVAARSAGNASTMLL
jgi:hypothetical protein